MAVAEGRVFTERFARDEATIDAGVGGVGVRQRWQELYTEVLQRADVGEGQAVGIRRELYFGVVAEIAKYRALGSLSPFVCCLSSLTSSTATSDQAEEADQ